MRNPLKQGLKRKMMNDRKKSKNNRNAKSTKTRIETYREVPNVMILTIAMRNPLKQGLKQSKETNNTNSHIRHIAMRNPLKQGLKPNIFRSRTVICISQCEIH